jgi:UDP-N-acetylglucosamine--N-acetylmuramyl-(pentapeptide) pyrophosphoryl-undecaprenol N-acetylglucosamine transferase
MAATGNPITVLILAGGTGGHVFPALAVAERLRDLGVRVEWLGTAAGLESRLVPGAGIALHRVAVSGLRGRGAAALLGAPLRLLRALAQSLAVLRRVRPRAVLGMGGFVSGPGGLAAWLLRIPLLVHEQNAVPGLTNRWLARFAGRAMEAFPGSLSPSVHARHTGNPVRASLLGLPPPAQRLAGRGPELRLLVLGGSQGAKALNEVVPAALARLGQGVAVWHQVGGAHLEHAGERYRQAGVQARLVGFIDDMADAYGWADLVLCRAGAMTVAEVAAVGVASILVPYPHAVDDHQSANARYLADAGAALLLPQPELDPRRLAGLLAELAGARERLLRMAEAARALAMPDAAAAVAGHCLEAVRG